jgi:ubiquitin fusion degradation protein 1
MTFSSSFLVVFPQSVGRCELSTTGKVLLPQFTLDRIMRNGFNQGVMLFALQNPRTKQQIGAGVESFTSDSASCVVPDWMAEAISLSEHDKVLVTLSKCPPATTVIFQPFDEQFTALPNPRVILEHSLRQIPCLTEGTIIPIDFNRSRHFLKVLKTEPSKIVSIVHADVSTDFARPLSMFDHHWGEEEDSNEALSRAKSPFVGRGRKLTDS